MAFATPPGVERNGACHALASEAGGNDYRSVIWRDMNGIRIRITRPEHLGEQIRRARKRRGLTQVELARQAGVGTRFVSELERGKPTVRLGLALEVASLAGVELLARERNPDS